MNARDRRDGLIGILFFLIWLTMVCGIGYVAVHFIAKFW